MVFAFALVVAWLLLAAASTVLVALYARGLPIRETPGVTPRVAVLAPMKGGGPGATAFLTGLLAQNYPAFRVIVAVESEDDAALGVAREAASACPVAVETVVAGRGVAGGQKVWNLLAAAERLREDDAVVVTVDADTLPDPAWLSRVVAGLVNARHDVVTGYRWMEPAGGGLPSRIVAAANASVATMPRGGASAGLCWGGTTAMLRETWDRLDVPAWWRGALSDDLQISRAARKNGLAVHAPRQVLLRSPVALGWGDAWRFGVRQHRLLWLHEPVLWAGAVALLLVPALGCAVAFGLALRGEILGFAALAASALLGAARAALRFRIGRALWPEAEPDRAQLRADMGLRPLWWLFHLACAVAAPWSRTVRWAGVAYRVRGPQDVEIVARD